jgi:hypothetical protein
MRMYHCSNCNKLTGFKRSLGFGTFFAVLLTFGFWTFLIPLYPKRCMTCGLRYVDSASGAGSASGVRKSEWWHWVIAGLFLYCLFAVVYVRLTSNTSRYPPAVERYLEYGNVYRDVPG